MPEETTVHRWKRKALGTAGILAGAASALAATVLLVQWADGAFDYRVPHACAALECLHGVAKAEDGRHHCAKYPPADLAQGAPGAAFRARRARGLAAAFAALGLAVLAAMAGGRWLRHALDFRWYRVAAPLAALLLSLYAGVTLASL